MSRPIERVVVPLDAASENRIVLETAARLAARATAPLHGVFVEDEDLLHLARLPFARQITAGAGAQSFTTEAAQLHLRAAAERARRELAAAANRHRVKYSFEIVRGGAESALSEVTERDVVVAGAECRPVAGHFRIERRWLAARATAPGPFLLARESWAAAGSVVVLLRDSAPSSAQLLAAAAQIAEARGGGLTAIAPAGAASTAGFETWLADQIAALTVPVEVEISAAEPAELQERLVELQCRLLAIEAGTAGGSGERLVEFARRFTCDVLIVG